MTAVADYTTSLQTSLQTAGYYDGPIDGVYGPSTVAAVEALQTDAELPVTGVVDQATAAALTAAVLAVNGDAASGGRGAHRGGAGHPEARRLLAG